MNQEIGWGLFATRKVSKGQANFYQNIKEMEIYKLSHSLLLEILLEARHLTDIELELAMKKNCPDVLGNCIHGDGTTKYNKKYQNIQVTLQLVQIEQ